LIAATQFRYPRQALSANNDSAAPTYTGPHRPVVARIANAIGGRLRRAGMRAPTLDVASLLKETRLQDARLDAPEDVRYLARLEALLADANGPAQLNFLGRVGIRMQLGKMLRNRLLARRWLALHPQTRATPLERPLFVVGQPRTGTTLLYMLLAQDPQSRAPLAWEVDAPVPPTDPGAGHLDPRYLEFDRKMRGLNSYVPGLEIAHAPVADEPEECYPLLESSALSVTFLLYFAIPEYWEHLTGAGPEEVREVYAQFRDGVALMQSRVPGRRWLSKSPAHLPFLDSLLHTFPDAGVVIPHRDPLESIPSLCSLVALTRSAASDHVDPAAIGRVSLDWFVESTRRAEVARAALGNPRILDVAYPRLLDDPIGTVRRLYEQLDYPYSDAFERGMRRWLAANPQHKRGVHRYSLAQFGLDADHVRAVTDDYRKRYLAG
jgi:hypothetical protein